MTNPKSDRVRRVRQLTTSAGRRRQRRFVVEGPHGVREAVQHSPELVEDIYLTVEASTRYPEIIDDAARHDVYLHLCAPSVVEAMSSDAQGTLAVLTSPERSGTSYENLKVAAALVEVRDPGNVGAIIRAADAAGAGAVVLTDNSVDVENPKVVRSSVGSLFHLPVARGGATEDVTAAAKAAGMQVLATAPSGTHSLDDLISSEAVNSEEPREISLAKPTLWLFGNEAHGLSAEDLNLADATVHIPIYGKAESLNLAAAATLCLYASARKHH